MATKLERLQVEIEANIKDLKKGCEEAKKQVRGVAEEAKAAAGVASGSVGKETASVLKKIKAINSAVQEFGRKARMDAGLEEPTREYQNLQKAIQKTSSFIDTMRQKQAALGDPRGIPTEAYTRYQAELANIDKEIDKIIKQQEEWASLGYDSKQIGVLDDKIEELSRDAERCEQAMKDLERTGEAFTPNERWGILQADIDAATRELRQYQAQEARMRATGADRQPTRGLSHAANLRAYAGAGIGAAVGKLPAQMQAVTKKAQQMAQSIANVGNGAKRHFTGVANDIKKCVGWLGKLKTGFGLVFAKIPLLNKFNIGLGSTQRHLDGIRRGIAGGLGLKNLLAYAGIGGIMFALFSNMRKGMENLVAYGGTTAQSVNTLKASLAQLQNSLATAFAPILNYITPALATLINYLSAAATAVARFFAALTGQKTVEAATSVGTDVASGMGDAAGATNAANDAAEKYKRTLMGFDKINKLEDPTKSGGSGGSGGGGGGAGVGSMFETIDVGPNKWADLIKKSWEEADFYEVGRILGEKVRDALNSINWDSVKEVGAKIGKSLATGLNGFIETPGLWDAVGTTIAEALNTLVITVNEFAINFHWESLGKAISDTINAFFSTFDFKLAAQTISNLAKGILDTAITAVENIDWRMIGEKVADFLANIDWIGIAKRVVTLLVDALVGAANLIAGFTSKIGEYITNYFKSGDVWKDLKDLGALTIELTVKLIGAAWTLFNTMVDTGVEVTATLVGSAWSFIKENVSNVVEFTAKASGGLWDYITKAVSNTVSFAGEMAGAGWDYVTGKIKTATVTMTAKLTEVTDAIADKTLAFAAKLTSWADGLKDKIIGFKANMNSWKDSLEEKIIKFKANMTSWKDSLEEKIISFKAKMTSWKDSLDDKVIKFKAKMDSWKDSLDNKVISFKAKMTSWSSALKNKVINFKAKLTSWTDALKKKTIKYKAEITSVFGAGWDKLKALVGVKKAKAKGGVYKGGSWHPVTAAASGGSFNQGQFFVAREAGPELVGTIGGNTAVMNNDQIVSSVSAGVAQAVAAVLAGGNSGGDVHIYLEGDADKLFKVVQQKADNYMNSTGMTPFPV